MPLYDYKCGKCGKVFEVRQSFSDALLTTHEDCGGPLERLISAPALQFKGSGWYITDYGRGNSGPRSAEKSGDKSGEKSSEKSGDKSEGKSESKAESKSDGKSESKSESKPESKSDSGSSSASTGSSPSSSSSDK